MTEPAVAVAAPGLVRAKLRPPSPPRHHVERPELVARLAARLAGARVLAVAATAGAGKTTAIADATGSLSTAWLTVDTSDAAPGRLLSYVEAAIAQRIPGATGVATGALRYGAPHSEAAGLLMEAVDAELVVVLDGLEALGEATEAWAVVQALIRYAPPAVTLVLLSRRELLCELPTPPDTAYADEQELAFAVAEARALMAQLDRDVDPASAVAATGGWVTGLLFEAWSASEHVAGSGGGADPLSGYLSAHILAQLDPADQTFLVRTALLDDVTLEAAQALGLGDAGHRLDALRAAHLPVTWEEGGRALRAHRRFREFLLQRLATLAEDDVRDLRLAHAQWLECEGQLEDAVEAYVAADAVAAGLPAAEAAILGVVDRLDNAVAERWLETFASVAPTGASAMTTAELLIALARDELRRCVRVGDQLEALGQRADLASDYPDAVWLLGWSYLHAGRGDDVEALLAAAEPGPQTAALEYAMQVMLDRRALLVRPEITGRPLDALVLVADYCLGRLSDLAESSSPWVDAVTGPWRIAALRAIGRTAEALELYRAAQATGAGLLPLQAFIAPDLLIDAGRVDEARETLEAGRRLAAESGALGYQGLNLLAEMKLALRLGDAPERALEVGGVLGAGDATARFRYVAEVLDAWTGLALLRLGRDDEAHAVLARAVAGMQGGDRLLELPTAAIYLAEACWRLGLEDESDAAADLALEVAGRQGSNHLLLQALRDFPTVASRRLDAEASSDSPWHLVGRALRQQGAEVRSEHGLVVMLEEFGRRRLSVGGDKINPRIAKTYELAAFLAADGRSQIPRDVLLNELFDGRNNQSAQAYLRQALHWLRRGLPEAATIESGRSGLTLSDNLRFTSESVGFEADLREASRLRGDERLEATLRALGVYERGDYLPGAHSEWTERRAASLADTAVGARYEVAELAFEASRFELAQAQLDALLVVEPDHEAAWRLAMRIAGALGDERAVITAFKGCEAALATVGTVPSRTTRRLLDDLRR